MRKLILVSILFLSVFTSFGQVPTFQWVGGIGGSGQDNGKDIVVDALGNVYTVGSFYATVDFDPGSGVYNLTSLGNSDVFISKLDNLGNLLWVKQFEGALAGYGLSIAVDTFGNIYTSGTFNGTVDFDPGAGTYALTGGGLVDLFISKLDSSGNFVWAKKMEGTTYYCQASSIEVDRVGNVYYTGPFQYTVDFDPSPAVFSLNSFAGSVDIVVSKLDSFGNFLWAKQIGGTGDDNGNSIVLDSIGNVYTTGYFVGTADFDPGSGVVNLTSAGYKDIFISKLDSIGNLLWAKSIGGSSYDDGNSIAIDDSNNVLITGQFQSNADFNPGSGVYNLSPTGTGDIFILKLDSLGNFIWARNMGSSTYLCGGNSIFTDSLGSVYTAGYYEGTVDFDPGAGIFNLAFTYGAGGPGTTIYPDIFILKLNSSGDFDWTVGMGGAGVDYANAIVVNKMNDVYTTGVFGNTVDFNPSGMAYNLSAASSQDIFIHKMSQAPLGIHEYSFNNNFINLFPNPASNNLTIETTKPTTILIVDLLGQELFNSKIEKSETIDVSFLANGVYFVKDLKNGGSVKFVKQ